MRIRILPNKAFSRTLRVRRIPIAEVPTLKAPEQIIIHQARGQAEQNEFANLKKFEANIDLEVPDAKKMQVVKDADGVITDYRNVTIKGYLSTFKDTTESDRQGDAVERGAFKETIPKFLENPILLVDHRNMVDNIAGEFTSLKEDKRGLAVEAELTNAPDMISVRFKVAEGKLRTLSMGGIWHFKEDGRTIFKVDLWEGSLVAIPANPDARFSARSLNDREKHYLKTAHAWSSYRHFLEAEEDLSKTLRE